MIKHPNNTPIAPATDGQIYRCLDCKFLDDQPEGTYMVHSIDSGMTMNFGLHTGGDRHIFSDMVLCPTHAAQRP